jgi:hypothetical protein
MEFNKDEINCYTDRYKEITDNITNELNILKALNYTINSNIDTIRFNENSCTHKFIKYLTNLVADTDKDLSDECVAKEVETLLNKLINKISNKVMKRFNSALDDVKLFATIFRYDDNELDDLCKIIIEEPITNVSITSDNKDYLNNNSKETCRYLIKFKIEYNNFTSSIYYEAVYHNALNVHLIVPYECETPTYPDFCKLKMQIYDIDNNLLVEESDYNIEVLFIKLFKTFMTLQE